MTDTTSHSSHDLELMRAECQWSMALEDLTAEETALVTTKMHRRKYDQRVVIFTYGSPADALLIVESGRIKMYHSRGSGSVFNIAIWPAGYTVGLLSVLLDRPRIVTVESVEETVIQAISRADLLSLMRAIPTFSLNIARLTASLARESLEITSPLVLDSATVRLCNVLTKLAVIATKDTPDAPLAIKGLNQDDLAAMVGVSRTWLTLMLSKLEEQGLIWRKRLEIGIHDVAGLEAFCRDN